MHIRGVANLLFNEQSNETPLGSASAARELATEILHDAAHHRAHASDHRLRPGRLQNANLTKAQATATSITLERKLKKGAAALVQVSASLWETPSHEDSDLPGKMVIVSCMPRFSLEHTSNL